MCRAALLSPLLPVFLAATILVISPALSLAQVTERIGPSNEQIGRLCFNLYKEKFGEPLHGGVKFGIPRLSALWRIEDGGEITGVRTVSQSEIAAKFVVRLTYLEEVTAQDQVLFGFRAGKKGETINREEECTLFQYDTGWRAEKITGPSVPTWMR